MDPGPGPTPRGREPVGDCRVGCMGRRSPGRSVGRGAPGACGRGRWKMGWPGTGRPGAGRAGAPGAACPAGAAGLIGALYTGRGPVCGMIMRGGGAPMGAADLGGTVAAGGAAAAGGCAAGGGANADGGATGGAGGLGGAETGAVVEALGGAVDLRTERGVGTKEEKPLPAGVKCVLFVYVNRRIKSSGQSLLQWFLESSFRCAQ